MRILLSSFAVLVATTVWAGGTTIKSNVVPFPAICIGIDCVGGGSACGMNSDCNLGSLSPKSKVSLTGAGRLKVGLKGVVDAAGMVASGNYHLNFSLFTGEASAAYDVEVVVADGKGKLDLVLPSLPVAGSAMSFSAPFVLRPATTPADCPSGNDQAAMTARLSDPDCNGASFAQIGVISGS